MASNLVLLLCATVLAVQTRNIKDEVNESWTLSLMIYSHFLFMVLRIVLLAIEGLAKIWELPFYHSLIFSLDAMFTCGLYFLPKFLQKDQRASERSRTTFAPGDSAMVRNAATAAAWGDTAENAQAARPSLRA